MSDKIIQKIEDGGYSLKELENLYSNAEDRGRIDIMDAVKKSLKQIDHKSYSRKYIKPIRDKIKHIAIEIAEAEGWAQWRDNIVNNGIKAGGPMLRGDEIAEYYFSYRHPSWKRSVYFVVFQIEENSAVQYKIVFHNHDEIVVDTSEEAISLFRDAISI
ncbi:MAG: hypothetical protein JAY74_13155 [Candidatus Thiodiazotropha taylori]|nr:hypothetical protein [Candidatus Thiodiazotropha taylori]